MKSDPRATATHDRTLGVTVVRDRAILLSRIAFHVALAMAAASPVAATAADLLGGFGGERGFGTEFLPANDDGSSDALTLPFQIDYFGQTFSQFFVNNNGNITFNTALSGYTPSPFPVTRQPMIAPWWADVDTRATGAGIANRVWVNSPNASTVVVTWDQVGYYSGNADKNNSFQLVMQSRADTGAGNFDAQFRYQQLQWTTGDASDGVNGLGGTPAQAGWDAGDGIPLPDVAGFADRRPCSTSSTRATCRRAPPASGTSRSATATCRVDLSTTRSCRWSPRRDGASSSTSHRTG